MSTAAELTALAERLRLTPRMRLFCELLAKDPERNHSAAARGAGTSEKAAHVTANRWLKVPKVQEYMAALTEAAVARAETHTEGAIASIAECLAIATNVARVNITDFLNQDGEVDVEKVRSAPAGVIRRLELVTTTTEEGQVIRRDRIELADNLRAVEILLSHHGEHDPEGTERALRSGRRRVVLELLFDEGKRSNFDALAARAQRKVIDVTAKRLR